MSWFVFWMNPSWRLNMQSRAQVQSWLSIESFIQTCASGKTNNMHQFAPARPGARSSRRCAQRYESGEI